MTDNPFQAPNGDASDPMRDPSVALVPIYSSRTIGWTTLLGSVVAGSVLILANNYKLGRPMFTATMSCFSICAAFVFAALVLPDSIPNVAYTVASVMGLRAYNQAHFGSHLAKLEAEAVPNAPGWHGLVVGLLVIAPFLLLFVAIVLLVPESL